MIAVEALASSWRTDGAGEKCARGMAEKSGTLSHVLAKVCPNCKTKIGHTFVIFLNSVPALLTYCPNYGIISAFLSIKEGVCFLEENTSYVV